MPPSRSLERRNRANGHSSASLATLQKSVQRLEETIRDIPETYAVMFNPMRNLAFTFLRGVAYGLGMIVAVVIVIPFVIAMLQSVQWVPLVGDFVVRVIQQMQAVRPL